MSENSYEQYARYLALKAAVYALMRTHPDISQLLAELGITGEKIKSHLLTTHISEEAISVFDAELAAIHRRLSEPPRQ